MVALPFAANDGKPVLHSKKAEARAGSLPFAGLFNDSM